MDAFELHDLHNMLYALLAPCVAIIEESGALQVQLQNLARTNNDVTRGCVYACALAQPVPFSHTCCTISPHRTSERERVMLSIKNWVVRVLNVDWLTEVIYQAMYHAYDKTCPFTALVMLVTSL